MVRTGSKRSQFAGLVSVVIVVAMFGLTAVLAGGVASAALVQPTEEPFPGGDPVCPAGQSGFRADNNPGTGEYTDGTLFVDVTFVAPTPASGAELSWAIDFGPGKSPAGSLVTQVVVKGGTPQNVYDYSAQPGGGVTGDSGLHAPLNPNSNKWYGVSHIDFCYLVTQPEPEVGSLGVAKVVAGDGAPAPGAVFTIDVDCDDDAFDRSLTFDAAGALDPAGQENPITGIPTGTQCSVTETGDGGADAVSYSPNPPTITIVADTQSTVTVTNTFDAPEPEVAELTIVKETDVETDDTFTFERSFGDDFVLGDGDSQIFTGLEAGEYTVDELVAEDWALEGVECGDADVELEGDGVTVTLAEGDAVTCTFTNGAVDVGGVVATPSPDDPEVAGRTVAADSLPFTGSPTAMLIMTALWALAFGGMLTVLSRVRRHQLP